MKARTKTLHFILLLLLCCCSYSTFAQTARAYERAGDKAMDEKEYYAASQYYKESIKLRNKSTTVYKFAQACRLFGAYIDADKSYAVVAKTKDRNRFSQLAYWQGDIKKRLKQYDKAAGLFRLYLVTDPDENSFYHQKAKQEIEACELAKQLLIDTVAVEVEWVDTGINTPFSEFAPHQVGDSLFYSSMRFKMKDEEGKERYKSKLLLSGGETENKPLSGFASKDEHAANSAISPDGRSLYFTRCEGGNSEDIVCSIYVRKKRDDGSWGRAKILPETVNFTGYTSTHPNVGFDSLRNKELLFFSSNRPGGQGKMDVWYSEISPEGNLGDAINLGEKVNSIDDEITPFFHTATQSLYFSSNWHQGLGGYDIFNTRLEDKTWQEPINAGYPLNSSYNDVYFVINEDNSTGYLSSNRIGSLSLAENEACCNDIYAITLNMKEDEVFYEDTSSVTFITAPKMTIDLPSEMLIETPEIIPTPAPPPPPPPSIPPKTIMEELEELLPVALYFHNDEPDSNTVRIVTKKNYEETYLWYYSLKDLYKTQHARGDVALKWKVDDFFEYEVRKGYEDLDLFSRTLLRALMSGYHVRVSIKGYTSPRAPSTYNENLAKRRISSVRNYFAAFEANVFQQFIDSGRLTFYETPFGETTAPAGISDAYDDARNSIYSVEASKERRVEIIEIERIR